MDISTELRVVEREISACQRVIASAPPAEQADLVQQCRIEAWHALRDGRLIIGSRAALRGWLRVVAARVVASCARLPRLDVVPAADAPEPHVPSAEELALSQTPKVELASAVAELARREPDLHAIIAAHDLEEQAIPEVATTLGIRQNTAWDRLRRGREALRGYLHRTRARGGLEAT